MEWTESSARHGISREDALYAIAHAEVRQELDGGRAGEQTVVYVGRAHAQTDQRLEVVVAIRPPRTMVIFHVMEVSDLYRHLLYRSPEEGERQ